MDLLMVNLCRWSAVQSSFVSTCPEFFFVFGACHGLSSVVLVTPALTAPGLTACAYSPVADSDSMQSVQGETWRNNHSLTARGMTIQCGLHLL